MCLIPSAPLIFERRIQSICVLKIGDVQGITRFRVFFPLSAIVIFQTLDEFLLSQRSRWSWNSLIGQFSHKFDVWEHLIRVWVPRLVFFATCCRSVFEFESLPDERRSEVFGALVGGEVWRKWFFHGGLNVSGEEILVQPPLPLGFEEIAFVELSSP